MEELFECHGHVLMDGESFGPARDRHRAGVDRAHVRRVLEALRGRSVVYFRDGGDALGVSLAAREMAAEHGIELRTPAFAIHKKGRYGSIVGREYDDRKEYRALLREAEREGADFIKLMFSGIITFRAWGELSGPSLPREEIAELIRIAHGEGFAVMAHVNGADAVRAAAEAGVDSVEHGYFLNDDGLAAMAESGTIWVPTLAAVAAFIGRDGFPENVARATLQRQQAAVRDALALGVRVAAGSDSGAVGVPHGAGTAAEYTLLAQAGVEGEGLRKANELLRRRFRRES